MAKRITPEEVIRFNQLYAKYGNFADVARETGRSASSVARYVQPKVGKAYINAMQQQISKGGN